MSPASDVNGFHLPPAAVGVAVVGALVGVLAAVVGVGEVVAVVVVGAFVGAAVGARVGARVGPPLSRVRPVRAALADAVSRQKAVRRAQACGEVDGQVIGQQSASLRLQMLGHIDD